MNLKKLNKTETELLACLRATDSYFVPKKTTTHGKRKENAAAKFEDAGYIVTVNNAAHYTTRQYRSTAKLWSDWSCLNG